MVTIRARVEERRRRYPQIRIGELDRPEPRAIFLDACGQRRELERSRL